MPCLAYLGSDGLGNPQRSDWARFQRLVTRALAAGPADGIADLEDALALVCGRRTTGFTRRTAEEHNGFRRAHEARRGRYHSASCRGACFARPGQRVFNVTADGELMMPLAGFHTAVRYQLPP